MRVVASLTTMPDRYDKVARTLQTIRDQTYPLDAIYLAVPTHCRRLDIPYPPLPETITTIARIVRCVDYGSITKLVGALLMEEDPDTIIITFDDDIIYHPQVVEKLVKRHQELGGPNKALVDTYRRYVLR